MNSTHDDGRSSRGARLFWQSQSVLPAEIASAAPVASASAYRDALRRAIGDAGTYRVEIASFLVRGSGLDAMGLRERLKDGSPLTLRLLAFPPLGLLRSDLEELQGLPTVEVREIASTDSAGSLSHLKLVIVHNHHWGSIAFFGSSNLTQRGLNTNLELNTVYPLSSEPMAGDPRHLFEELWSAAGEPHPELYAQSDSIVAQRNLLPFQVDAYQRLRSELQHGDSVALVLPTGAGKTIVAMRYVLQEVLRDPAARVVWVAPMRELLHQALAAYHASEGFAHNDGVRVRMHSDHTRKPVCDAHLELWTIQSLYRRREEQPPPRLDLLVLDEAHWGIGRYNEMTPAILSWARPRKRLGLTATPFRGIFEEQVDFLRQFPVSVPPQPPPEDVTNSAGERVFAEVAHTKIDTGITIELRIDHAQLRRYRLALASDVAALRAEVNKRERNQLIAKTWCDARSEWGATLAFAIDVDHANALGRAFAEEAANRGLPLPRIQVVHTRELPTDICVVKPAAGSRLGWAERHEVARRLRAGEIDLVIAVDLYNMGVDFPSVSTLFLARPTLSPVRYMQMLGRGLRGPAFGGTAVCHVVDFCDQVHAHKRVVNLLMSYDDVKLGEQRPERRRDELLELLEGPKDEPHEFVYPEDGRHGRVRWYWLRDEGDASPCFWRRRQWTTPAAATAELGGPDACCGTFWSTEFRRTLAESRDLKRRQGKLVSLDDE